MFLDSIFSNVLLIILFKRDLMNSFDVFDDILGILIRFVFEIQGLVNNISHSVNHQKENIGKNNFFFNFLFI